MAQKSSTGTVKNGRDSVSKRLGLKRFHNQYCKTGQILIRQKGLKFVNGQNIGRAKDFTLYALKDGILKFKKISQNRKIKIKLTLISNNWQNLLYFFQFKNLKEITFNTF